MFRKILIANRGEIACRVIRTARRMGIATVAVYSAADAGALHVEMADEAWPIGPAPARQSYLRGEVIIEAARRSGAQAIHPGYGFLSENAAFAEACAAAGLVFIGPPPDAIRAMGSKAAAKALMQQSGVPLVPGYHGEAQEAGVLAQAAGRIGYPVLIKASAGGGGKGMRVVEQPEALAAALEGARREALASFGDGRLLIEKYLAGPRHIEIQVFADTYGQVISLFERDCSIQRRHQKVLEEAPAPGMDPARRAAMGEAAIAAARAVGYVGAGTVEFIAEGDVFYFMEMNTRLQVEHPVTELITGLDLVEWQLRVASGEALPLGAEALRITGHAIEARIYAEDPERDFLPSIGTLVHLRQPTAGEGIRVDTGVRQGDAITPNYDPMIAKLIAWGEDRAVAVRRLAAALAAYEVVGVSTNLGLLRRMADHPEFQAGGMDTGFIARHAEVLLAPSLAEVPPQAMAAAVLAVLADRAVPVTSPWDVADAWRMNGTGHADVLLRQGDVVTRVQVTPGEGGLFALGLGDTTARARLQEAAGNGTLWLDGVSHRLAVVRLPGAVVVLAAGESYRFQLVDALAPPRTEAVADGRLTAPIPARITRVLVQDGDVVAKGAPLIVLEAMKMEMTLSAPFDGTVESVRHSVDEMVGEGTDLVIFVPA